MDAKKKKYFDHEDAEMLLNALKNIRKRCYVSSLEQSPKTLMQVCQVAEAAIAAAEKL